MFDVKVTNLSSNMIGYEFHLSLNLDLISGEENLSTWIEKK